MDAGADGSIYVVVNAEGGRVRRVTPNGIITTVVAEGSAYGVAVDGAGNLFIADASRIRKVSSDGITTVAAGLSAFCRNRSDSS